MALAVDDIIERAREHHEAFGEAQHPDTVCLSFLSRYHRSLASQVGRLDPFSLATVQSIVKATWEAGWDEGDTGVAAEDHHQYLQGRAAHENNVNWDIVHFSPWPARPRDFRDVNDHLFPAFSIVAGNIYFHGRETDWTRYSDVELLYVPMTAALAFGGSITLPDSAESALVTGLAHFLSRRSSNVPGAPSTAEMRAEWMMSERQFLDEIGDRRKPLSSVTLDVW